MTAGTWHVDTSTNRFPVGAANTHYRGIPDPTAAERCAAVRAVASAAHDAQDCARLLDLLGLDPAEGVA